MPEDRAESAETVGHCVLCTPAEHGNREEYKRIPMVFTDSGDELEGEVVVCQEHYYVIKRSLRIQTDGVDRKPHEHDPVFQVPHRPERQPVEMEGDDAE